MTPAPIKPEEAIFLAALEKGSRQEREAYLASACGGDAVLAARVRELLAAHDGDSGPLDATLPGLAASTQQGAIERPGTQIGPYKLLQVIGEGGMGVVYMASQREPVERRVALKIIKPGMDSRQVIARFEAERQALALMDHPNIARVLDGGTTGEVRSAERGARNESEPAPRSALRVPHSARPYFVMELVKGVPITQYCDEHHLTARQRLELFVPVCQAIQHAHQKGIIHRDIKPTNILVAEYDQQPVPKIIDFGVAKAIGQRLTEKTMFTEFGQVVGTIEYMSPEQAKLNQLDIDTRTDIYSLGVLLYELLAGETPFDKQRLRSAAFDEVLRIIREEEPPRPSTRLSSSHSLPAIAASRHTEPRQLASQLRGELDWIVMKALEKDRNRRYETASGLAMDLVRYLHDEPVLACPPSAGYRLSKFARRNKRTLVTGTLFAVLVIGAITAIGSIGGWALRDRTAQRTAAAQRIALDRAERSAVLAQEIEAALGEVTLAYSHDRLGDAQAAQKRAASLWASGSADPALKKRIEQWRADLQLAQRLDEIRLEQAAVKDGHFDRGAADPAYREAFTHYGLDFDRAPASALASRIRAAAIRDRLVPALDEWLDSRMAVQLPGAEVLVAVAALADADPWRNRLRQASLSRNPKELLALAQEADVVEHPATSLLLLASLLRGSGQLQPAIDLLEQAQQHYPVDFWINQNLGLYLMQLPAPPVEKALGYYRAAVTLRPSSPGVRLNLGNALRRLRRFTEAERAYRAAVELKPDYAEAHSNLGLALIDQERLDEAERALLRAVELRPNYPRAVANLGAIYLAQDRLPEAEFCCRSAALLDPDDAFVQKILGDLLLKLDHYEEAEAAYREVVRLDPRAGRPHQDVGTVLQLQGRMAEAAEEFQLALRLDPRLSQSQTGLNNAKLAARTPAEMEAGLKAEVARDPTNGQAHLLLADVLLNKGDQPAAEAEYREALRLSPDSNYARQKLVPLLSNAGRAAEAETLYRQLIKARPNDVPLRLDFCSFLIGRNLYDQAASEARAAIQINPKLAVPHSQLARILGMLGQPFEAALPEFQTALALEPNNASVHGDFASALAFRNRDAEALAEYRTAVRLSPTNAHFRLSLAELLAKMGSPAEAEAEYRESLRLLANFATARRSFGEFLAAQNRPAEAEIELRQAVRLSPTHVVYRKSLIDLLVKQGQRDAAIVVYRDAIRQQPFALFRYTELATFLEAGDQFAEAEQVLRDAVAALPESTAARERLASSLSRRGQSAGAAEELRALVRARPDDAGLQQRLARALKEQGLLADAAAAAREAVRLNPQDPANYYLLADVYQTLGQPDDELAALRQLVTVQPQDGGAHQRLAGVLSRLNRFAEAEAAYREGIARSPLPSLPVNYGLFLFNRGRWADAEATYREVLKINPSDPYSLQMLGQALVNLGQNEAGEAEFRKALALNPELQFARGGLARVLDKLGRTDEAIAEFRVAMRNPPQDGFVQQQFGNLLLRRGEYAEAEKLLSEAARLRPQDTVVKNDLTAARNKAQAAASEPALREAVRANPADHAAHHKLGQTLFTLANFAGAQAACAEAVRLSPADVAYRRALALALSRQKKLAEEETQRREIVRLTPADAKAHFSLGNALARQARWSEARDAFAKAVELDPKDHWAWYGVTVLRLETGDALGYRQASREMLARFENAAPPEIWERTAKTCLLTADGAGELKRAVALAEKTSTGTERHTLYWYFQLTRGLAELRAGHPAAARDWLEKFLAREQRDSDGSRFVPFYVLGRAALALTEQALNHPSEAAAALAQAEKLLEQYLPDGSPDHPFELDWDDWLRARLLTREAAAALAAAKPVEQPK